MKQKGVGELFAGINAQLKTRPKLPVKVVQARPARGKPKLRVVASSRPNIPEPPTAVDPIVTSPPLKARVKVSPEALMRSRGRPAAKALPKPANIHQFILANHPPSVFPRGYSTLAMDEAIDTSLAWASQALLATTVGAYGYQPIYEAGLGFLGYTYLAELSQRAEYRVISETLATESTRKWIKLQATTEDGEDRTDRIKELEEELDRLKVQDVCRTASLTDGFMGRSHVFVDTGDTDNLVELKTPIGDGMSEFSQQKFGNKKGFLKGFRNVEPVWCYPSNYNAMNPLKPDFYNPGHWYCQGQELAASRLLTFVGREVPDLLKPAYSFGGLSMSQMVKPTVDNWLRTRQSVSDITHAFSTMVLETDLATTLSIGGEDFFNRIDFFNATRDNRGLMAVNKGTEELKNVSAPLGSLDKLQAQAQEHMSSISRIPIVKLLGIQPAGLNASSEGEMQTWDDWVAAYQELFYGDKLRRMIAFAQLNIWGAVDPSITFAFEPLRQMTEKERGEIRKNNADTDVAYVNAGVLDPAEVRAAVAADEESPYSSIDVDDVPEPPAQPGEGGEGGPNDGGGGPPVGETDESEVAEDGVIPFAEDAEFNEGDHPRGQPGNAGQFGSGGGAAKPDAGKILTAQYAAAQKKFEENSKRGDRWGTSEHILPDGSALYTSLRPRQSNSRGARRGGHMATEYYFKRPEDENSKRISREKAVEVLSASPAPSEPEPQTFNSKKEHAAHLLEKGVTTKEMLTALGWPSISMPQMAKTLAMKLEKVKDGKVTRYKGTLMTAAERKAAGIKDPSTGRGPSARDQATWSLTEYLAHLGGIKSTDPLIGDVHGSIGRKNKLIPGFGPIVRPTGMTLDKAREAAVEAGYISRTDARSDNTTVRTLLDAMDNEFRGRKVYRQGVDAPDDTDRDRESHINAIETSVGEALSDAEIDPSTVPPSTMSRIVEIMDKEGERDPLIAYERAVMEETNESPEDRIDDVIEGWDVPDDAGAAPAPSR